MKPYSKFLTLALLVVQLTTAYSTTSRSEPLTTSSNDYYASALGKSGSELRALLHDIIDDHTRYPYTSTATDCWDILNEADEDPNVSTNILDLYKNASYAKISGGTGAYNREHTWPKSYGFPDDRSSNYPYTDCHQLMACDASYNSSRSNLPYDCGSASDLEKPTEINNGQGGGTGAYPGNSNWRSGSGTTGHWETWIGKRGDVARALFYLDVRYEGGTHGTTGHSEPDLILTDDRTKIASCNTGNNETNGYMGVLSTLLIWHKEDPVDDLERARNEVIFSYQGNRNPFIDHPEWVEDAFMPSGRIATLSNGLIRISWENSEIATNNIVLVSASDLSSSNAWEAVTNQPQQDVSGWYIELSPSEHTNKFFKLSL